ncbi:hypothetical protein D917_10769, partial [Trichinella nativa]
GVLYVVNVRAAAQHALSYHLVSDGKQWRFLDVPRIVFSHPRSYSNNSCFSVYFQLLLLFVMLLCCYPCEHGSLPEQNAKRELAIPDVATTGSLLRKQKSSSRSLIPLPPPIHRKASGLS